jgi:GxxExxY protein
MSPLIRHETTAAVIAAAIDVHRGLGPGLLESAYDECLAVELADRRLPLRRQVAVPVFYKGTRLSCGYRVDFIVGGELVVEVKAVERILPIHHAQVLTYLRLLGLHRALLMNFNVPRLVDGLKSFLHGDPTRDHPIVNHEDTQGMKR